MNYPKNAVELVDNIVKECPDVQDAIERALGEVKKLPNYKSFINELLERAIREMVYDSRHRSTVKAKRESNSYGGGAKVKSGTKGVESAYRSFCDSYFIGGKSLAMITGGEIPELVTGERGRANGHMMNVKLLEWIQGRGVSEEESVAEWMKRTKTSDAQLRERFKLLEQDVLKTPA